MEKAIHITKLENLKYFQENKYQRIYWGAEFCQNLIPGLKDTENILRFTRKNNLKLSLVAPFLTDQGLRKLALILTLLKKNRICADEIIVNDWGLLNYLNKHFPGCFELVLGRLLVRQQRDPAMKRVLEKQVPFAFKGKDGKIRIIVHRVPDKRYQQGAMSAYINSPLAQKFLSKFGIVRVELNNLIQGINIAGINFKKSLYTPFVNISTTRFCPMQTKFQRIYRINVCHQECQGHYDILRNKSMPKAVYKRGNTTFYKNPVSAKDIAGLDVDRTVFQPELPL